MADSAQLDRLNKRFAAIPKSIRDAVQPALLRSGNELADTMKALAETSRDTGALIDSIEVTTAGQSTPAYSQPGGSTIVPDNAVMVTAGNSKVRYAHLVEWGTSRAPAQPYFFVAYRLSRKKITGRIKRAMSKAVRDGWAK